MRRVSTGRSSATGPQVTAGVWTVEDRREREPELHPEPHLLTVMSLVRDRPLLIGHLSYFIIIVCINCHGICYRAVATALFFSKL